MNNIEKIKPTGLFTNYIFKAIPLAFDESLSYYETLCGLLNYIKNTVIPTVNNNADAISELQNLYIELKNYVDTYFDNLDVQEEINNKLDEMAQNGELEILLAYAFENAQSIARDTLFETIEDAFEKCIEKNYILYLTKDYNITLSEDINIPSIIGNGHKITTTGMNTRFLINNKKIENVIFESVASNQSNYCLELNNGEIKNCIFYNYVLPIKCVGKLKNNISNCYTYNCAQGVYARESDNLNIDNLNFINNETQRNYYRTNLSSLNGIDGVLLELCNNVKIENSSFEFCIERVLYSADSENVQFNNNYMKNTNGIKFVGYTKICNNFNANNNIMYNSYDDAFCQLYECNNINLTNNKFDCDDEPYCIGWVVRAGHTVKNVNITGNDMNYIKRSIFHWLDTFPDTISKNSYILQNINISNNNFKNIGLIAQLHYPAINIENKNTDGTYDTNNIEINNNTIYSRNYSGFLTFSQGNKAMKNLFYCHHANNVNIFNNNVKGIYDKILPGIDCDGCTNVNGDLNVIINTYGEIFKQFNPVNGNFNVKVNYNSSDVSGYANYNINNNNVICEMNIKENNKPLYIQFENNYNIQVNSFNKGESANLYYDGTNVYAEGTGAKTELTGDQTDIFLYIDNEKPTLRVRGNNEHNYKILFSLNI